MAGPGPDGVTIRPLAAGDAAAYAALRRAMLLDEPIAFASSPEDDRASDEGAVREMFAREGNAVIGAFDGSRLAGAAGLARDRHVKMRHRALVWGVWVEPRSRRRGLGERILRGVIDIARSWGVERLVLSASADTPGAVRLYERVGFVRWGVEPDVLRYDGGSHDEVYLSLRL